MQPFHLAAFCVVRHCYRHVVAVQRPFADLATLSGWAMEDEQLTFVRVHFHAHLCTAGEGVLDDRGHAVFLRFFSRCHRSGGRSEKVRSEVLCGNTDWLLVDDCD